MSLPFIGEIRLFGGNFAPVGWAFCNGQLLPISEHDALFALIGTTYGGDGQTTFGLPDLQGRSPVHQGSLSGTTYVMGEAAGVETVTLTTQQIPAHSHRPTAGASPNSTSPAGATWSTQAQLAFATGAPGTPMAAGAMQPAGGSQPHDNMPPYLAISYIIALEGVFPSQN